jgi:hypothetical protein
VAVAAATTLVIGIATLPGGEPRRADATVEERIIAATDDAFADHVVVITTDYESSRPGIDSQTWFDITSGAIRTRSVDEDGATTADFGPAVPPAPGDVAPEGVDCVSSVDGRAAEVWQIVDGGITRCIREGDQLVSDGQPAVVMRTLSPCDETYADQEMGFLPVDISQLQVRDLLEDGWLVADGTEVVEGRELIALRFEFPDDLSDADVQPPVIRMSGPMLYVDPDTYLPVESRFDGEGPGESAVRFEYLPRTEENLRLLSPPVPEGYSEVDEPLGCDLDDG